MKKCARRRHKQSEDWTFVRALLVILAMTLIVAALGAALEKWLLS